MSNYKHFTLEERNYLQRLREEGYGIRKIARSLGRSPSSISREIKRNSSSKGYHHWRANCLSVERKRKSNTKKRLSENSALGSYVREKLSKYWSPECIAQTWNIENPSDHLGHSTIYRWLKTRDLEGYSRKTHLRRRGKRKVVRKANYNTIHPDRLIADRPKNIRKRKRIGDWESDTVCGAIGKGLIVTLVDRKSRYLCAALLKNKTAEETKNSLISALKNKKVCSLSLDNGSEFALFREIEKEIQAPIYFAKPHAPWERGTNENTNGLLRFFFPKGFDFLSLSDDDLQKVVDLLNNRPRKCLGWKTPAQVFHPHGVALT